jgi:dihydrofolate reductase
MQCSVFIAVSLDGFVARLDGSVDWLSLVESPGEDYGYQRFFDSIDTLVVGRSTYQLALGFEPWPYQGKRCIVLAHTETTSRHGEEFFAGEVSALATRLAAEGAKRVYVDGGAVIQQFLDAGLIHDLTLSVIPVLLGAGIPLFGAKNPRDQKLELLASRSFPSGLVQTHYRVLPRRE